jgi:L-lactate dehydrogenase
VPDEGVARNVVLYDINQAKWAEALDISTAPVHAMETIQGSAGLEICRMADMVVVTAGAKQKPGQSRMELAGAGRSA